MKTEEREAKIKDLRAQMCALRAQITKLYAKRSACARLPSGPEYDALFYQFKDQCAREGVPMSLCLEKWIYEAVAKERSN